MNALMSLATLIAQALGRGVEIALFRKSVEGLPDSTGFLGLAWVLLALGVMVEQIARGHGIAGALAVSVAWLVCVGVFARKDKRVGIALCLGILPVCLALALVAGHDVLEWLVAGWGSAVGFKVIVQSDRESALWP